MEQHVPTGLEVEANLLKTKEDNFEKKQTLVSKHVIKNPVDTTIGSYELTSSSKERVVLTKDSANKINENTGKTISVGRISEIQIVANSIENLNQYEQIKSKFENNAAVKADIEKLRSMSNVVLK